jgi:hypothetical protein
MTSLSTSQATSSLPSRAHSDLGQAGSKKARFTCYSYKSKSFSFWKCFGKRNNTLLYGILIQIACRVLDYILSFVKSNKRKSSCCPTSLAKLILSVPRNPDKCEAVKMSSHLSEAPCCSLSRYAMQLPCICTFNSPGSDCICRKEQKIVPRMHMIWISMYTVQMDK